MITKKRMLIIISILTVLLLISLLVFNLYDTNLMRIINMAKYKVNVDYIQRIVESFGVLGVLIYILINCIRPLFFIPTSLMYISGGIIYGTFKGSIYTLIGLVGGASIPFFLARKFQGLFKKILGNKHLDKINKISDNNNIIRGLFMIRVTPGLPFDIISYVAGMSNISYKKFLIGTLLGAFPKIVLYTLLGDQINNIFSVKTLIAFVILLGLAVLPYVFRGKLQTFNK